MRSCTRAAGDTASVFRGIGRLKAILLGSTGLMLLAQPALAQQAPAQPTLDQVVVTGSRIANNGFQQPTPVTVVGTEELNREMPPTVADYLNQLPSFGYSYSARNPGDGVAGGGTEAVNLRDLGTTRTLVLLDNRRVVAASPSGGVDTLTIPSSLIKRVEIVTGGASAAWGADAVAGVVNFVLNHDFQGLQLNVQAGISQEGDDRQVSTDLTFGRQFRDGRIRWIGNVKYSDSPDVVKNTDRSWWRNRAAVTNPAYAPGNGQPKLITMDFPGQAGVAPGGVITSGPLRGVQFIGQGTPAPYDFGHPSGQLQWGGDVDMSISKAFDLAAPIRYGNAFTHVDFDLTDNITAYAEFGVDESKYNDTGYFYYERVGNLAIQADNAYLDPSIRQQLAARGLSSFNMGLTFIARDPPHSVNDRQVYRGVVGLDGRFGENWKWGAYYQHGVTKVQTHTYNNPMPSRFLLAVDAVRDPNTGAIVCRSTLTNPTNGCVPLDVFGDNVSSQQARQYVQGIVPWQNTHVQLDVVSADASGKVFTLPTGDVSAAFGVDYYREEADSTNDPLSTQRLFATGNFQPFSGSRNVKEAFVETSVPVLKDLPLVRSLELNAAGRITDYSTSGSVETWKLGATYQVTDDLRFRVTRSKDIRAPTLNDLYSNGNSGTQNVFDPVLNKTAQVFFVSSGNPDLKPEDADTLTAGVVYHPHYIPGLGFSLDYYRISITGAIVTVGSAQTVARCYDGTDPALCRFIVRDSSGAIVRVNSAPQNIDKLFTSGYDFELDYHHSLGPGDINIRALATYLAQFNTTDAGVTTKSAGYVNLGSNGIDPYLRGNISATYTQGPMSYTLRSRLVGPTKLNRYWASGVDIDQNNLPAYADFGLTLVYSAKLFGVDSELTFDVENLFNTEPVQVPVLPSSGIYSFPGLAGRYDLYDPFGREFRIGYRARW
jgi:iron complex outermembrane receptor protein